MKWKYGYLKKIIKKEFLIGGTLFLTEIKFYAPAKSSLVIIWLALSIILLKASWARKKRFNVSFCNACCCRSCNCCASLVTGCPWAWACWIFCWPCSISVIIWWAVGSNLIPAWAELRSLYSWVSLIAFAKSLAVVSTLIVLHLLCILHLSHEQQFYDPPTTSVKSFQQAETSGNQLGILPHLIGISHLRFA